jgi:hypothetical protein
MTAVDLEAIGLAALVWRIADLRALELEDATPANQVLPPDWTETRESRAAMNAWKAAHADAVHAWDAFTSLLWTAEAEYHVGPNQTAMDF